LTDAERHRLLNQCAEIIGKDDLNQTVAGDAVRRVLKDAASK